MSGPTIPIADLDPSDPAFLADPYPTYAALRPQRVQWAEGVQSWVAADYRSVVELSKSRFFVRSAEPAHAVDDASRTLQRVEGADHARLRSTVAPAFRGASVRRLAADIAHLADGLVAGCCAGATADLMSELAHPLSIRAVAIVLGLPGEDLDALIEWTAVIAAAMGPAPPAAARSSAMAAGEAIAEYVARVGEARRRQPRDDLVSRLVGDRRLSRGEGLAMIRLLLFTGSHPMALALGNALLLLARRPEQWETLLRRPALVPRAVEECLRFDPVIQMTSRRALATVDVAGRRIEAGDEVILLCGSANRDEGVFRRPDVFDVMRDPNPHLTFGRGTHACLAPMLARLEVGAALESMVRRRVAIRSAGRPRRLASPVLRGLERLPARLEPARCGALGRDPGQSERGGAAGV